MEDEKNNTSALTEAQVARLDDSTQNGRHVFGCNALAYGQPRSACTCGVTQHQHDVRALLADRTRLQTALAAAEGRNSHDVVCSADPQPYVCGCVLCARERADAAEQQAATLRAVLQALYDVQNGAPLEKYRSDWEAAMEQAHALLAPPPRRTEGE